MVVKVKVDSNQKMEMALQHALDIILLTDMSALQQDRLFNNIVDCSNQFSNISPIQ